MRYDLDHYVDLSENETRHSARGLLGQDNYLVVLAENRDAGFKAFSKIILLIFKDVYDIIRVIGRSFTRLIIPKKAACIEVDLAPKARPKPDSSRTL